MKNHGRVFAALAVVGAFVCACERGVKVGGTSPNGGPSGGPKNGGGGAAAVDAASFSFPDLGPITAAPGGGKGGCSKVDVLFVIDNSASMCRYQRGLAKAFPTFVDAINKVLPKGTNVHVGITTTSFCVGGSHSENNCVAAESDATIRDNFKRPTEGLVTGNGFQGRLLESDGKRYFEASTGDDASVAPLKDWFARAATSVGCSGCSFDYSVGGAGYVAHPANKSFNDGFLRDQGTVLLVFLLTDEADHSPDGVAMYHDMLASMKSQCGGDKCIIAGGLLSTFCANDKTSAFKFLNSFGEPASIGDISGGLGFADFGKDPDPAKYSSLVGDSLALVVQQTCDRIVIP